MAIPNWKYWLSYLWEQEIEHTSSDYNPFLHLTLNRGRLQLSADQAVYSYGDLYLNFRKTFERFRFGRLPEQADVLLLGLGLGSIPWMLEHTFSRRYRYTAVEIDEVIIDMASEYVLPELSSPLELICADALAFMTLNPQQYDLICMDVFQDAEVPSAFEQADFLEMLGRSLRPGGVLLYNRLAATEPDRKRSMRFHEQVFSRVFPDNCIVPTGGNYMLVHPAAAVK